MCQHQKGVFKYPGEENKQTTKPNQKTGLNKYGKQGTKAGWLTDLSVDSWLVFKKVAATFFGTIESLGLKKTSKIMEFDD